MTEVEEQAAVADPTCEASADIGTPSRAWLVISVGLAVLAAAPAIPALGISVSNDVPMFFMGWAVVAMVIAALLSERGFVIPGARTLGILCAVGALAALSAALSDFMPFAVFGTPRSRLGLLTYVPAAMYLVVARGFSLELGKILRRLAPWVIGAWTLAVIWQARSAPLSVGQSAWGLSSNGALTAQLWLLLLPAFIMMGRRNRWVRLSLGLAVVAVLWRAGSAIGIALTVAWIGVDALLTRGVVRRIPRRILTLMPAGHLVTTAAIVGVGATASWAGAMLGGRQGFWRMALALLRGSPVLGVGYATFTHAAGRVASWATVQTLLDDPGIPASTHSIWMDVAVGLGLVGVAAVLVATTMLARRWSERVNAPGFTFTAGLLLYSVTLFVQPLQIQTVPILVLVMVASLPPREDVPAWASAPWVKSVFVAATLSSAIVLALFGWTCIRVGRPEYRPGPLEFTESAARLWRFEPELWAQSAYRQGMQIGTSPNPDATVAAMEADLQRAIDLVPRDDRYRLDLAKASEQLGKDPARVRELYNAALAEYPLSPFVNQARGLFLAKQGDRVGARATYELLRQYYPTWSGTESFAIDSAKLGTPVR